MKCSVLRKEKRNLQTLLDCLAKLNPAKGSFFPKEEDNSMICTDLVSGEDLIDLNFPEKANFIIDPNESICYGYIMILYQKNAYTLCTKTYS